MKGFVLSLLCLFVAVQARSFAPQNSQALAAPGENPWVVHLRIAVSTSGLLNSCVGSLIDSSWVLSSSSCLQTARFVWIRYGAVSVANPELVTESSAVRLNAAANLGLVSINRFVEPTANIQPISIGSALPSAATLCSYGALDNGAPGVQLSCSEVSLTEANGGIVGDITATLYDLGAPLVADGQQIGILVGQNNFVRPSEHLNWLENETGLTLSQ